ncbi:MAG: ATP synthase F1 subunit delta [Bacillota bacterium]|jgi:F-type H+-transporting ATPase subunit delta
MSSNVLAMRYAAALFAAATDIGKEDEVAQDLHTLTAALDNQDLADVFYHLQLTAVAKRRILEPVLAELLQEQISRNFVWLLFAKGRERQMKAIGEAYLAKLRAARGQVVAEVTSARQLSGDDLNRLTEWVQQLTGSSSVELVTSVNKGVLGGVRVRVADTVYDGSLSRRLQMLQRQLKRAQVKQAGVSN